MSTRTIGFAFNPTISRSDELRRRGRAWCEANGAAAWEHPADDHEAIARRSAESDLVCVLGGDGTFLRVARAIGDSGTPALGVNLGRIGFLAQVEPDGFEEALGQFVADEYTLQERLRLSATIVRGDGRVEAHACLNEAVVARGTRVRMIEIAVEVSGSHLATYVADGVVVATPTGSTAYSFSAGGAILDPRLRNMIITPVAAYLSALHSVIAGEDHVITLSLLQARHGAVVSLDGQLDVEMAAGDRVEVRALDVPLRMVELRGSTPFYDLLRTKASLLAS
jgi:NAD+ kinase